MLRGGLDGGLRRERGRRRVRRAARVGDELALHADDAAVGRDVGVEPAVVDLDAVDFLAEVEVGDAAGAAHVFVRDGDVAEVGFGEAEGGAAGTEVVERRRQRGALRLALGLRQRGAQGERYEEE